MKSITCPKCNSFEAKCSLFLSLVPRYTGGGSSVFFVLLWFILVCVFLSSLNHHFITECMRISALIWWQFITPFKAQIAFWSTAAFHCYVPDIVLYVSSLWSVFDSSVGVTLLSVGQRVTWTLCSESFGMEHIVWSGFRVCWLWIMNYLWAFSFNSTPVFQIHWLKQIIHVSLSHNGENYNRAVNAK